MKNEIRLLVVCSVTDVNKLKQELNIRGTEVKVSYEANDYEKALEIINNDENKIDAILVKISADFSNWQKRGKANIGNLVGNVINLIFVIIESNR